MIKCPDDPVSAPAVSAGGVDTNVTDSPDLAPAPCLTTPRTTAPGWARVMARVQGQLVFRALIEINPDTLAWPWYLVYTLATLFTPTPACLECLISAGRGFITKQ